ncbi:Type I restriction-modification system, specificity subunit S [Janthinobacterium sp. CG23_2]|nr:Type I restriction-modification system, specificity subunit S [Janthinobacterium sp. CG23_2]CUU27983.1 Type I restriction-modification system, specificity subunit S [Janthinobacterium sp. CG23_2]
MSSEIRTEPLGNFVKLFSGNTPSKSNPAYWGEATPWISAKDMGEFWIEDSEDHLTPEGVEVASRLVPSGTVLLLTRGMTLHKRVPICRTARPATFNQDVKAVLAKEGLSARYLPYLLTGNHDRLHQKVDSAGHGTGRLNSDAVLSFPVWIPELTEQESIADLGEALDERIRLLRKTNITLEAIAQALFKSWFVDFDPVRAKMEGRVPEGMDEATAALFPEALVKSKLGFVPNGWLATTLAEQTSRHGGSIQTGPFGSQLHASDYSELGTPVAMPKDIENRRINTSSVARVAEEHVIRLARHQLSKGDIVFSRRGDVERHALVMEREEGWLCGTGCLLVRPGKTWKWPAYLSMLLDTPQVRLWLVQHAVGATMPNLNTGILGSIPLVEPRARILDKFEPIVMALELRRSENLATMETLAVLRDTLLPRLISGQLRLPEAAVEIEAIAA